MLKQNYDVGIYVRLSKDDERAGESVSIENQKLMLRKYVTEQGWNEVDYYIDDGFSGTNLERPGIQRLLEDAKDGRVNLILVKDMSRLGRNYIEVGRLTDYVFPMIGCRFIALNDGVDLIHSDNVVCREQALPPVCECREQLKRMYRFSSPFLRCCKVKSERMGAPQSIQNSLLENSDSSGGRACSCDFAAASLIRCACSQTAWPIMASWAFSCRSHSSSGLRICVLSLYVSVPLVLQTRCPRYTSLRRMSRMVA
jgi:hypothetical protein